MTKTRTSFSLDRISPGDEDENSKNAKQKHVIIKCLSILSAERIL